MAVAIGKSVIYFSCISVGGAYHKIYENKTTPLGRCAMPRVNELLLLKEYPELEVYFLSQSEQEKDKAISEAAGLVAGAIATAYFGPVVGGAVDEAVTAISNAILSADDDRFEREMVERLTRIEGKIDSILWFFNNKFKGFVSEVLDVHEINALNEKLSGDLIKIKTAIRVFESADKPSDSDAQLLVLRAEDVLDSGLLLLKKGKERYMIAIHSFSIALSAVNLARRVDSKYASVLSVWAESYLKVLNPWLIDVYSAESSFGEIRAELAVKLNDSRVLIKDLVEKKSVLYLTGVFQNLDIPAGVGASSFGVPTEYEIDDGYVVRQTYRKDLGRLIRPQVPDVGDMSVFGFLVHPKFPPMIGPPGMRNLDSYWRYFSSVGAAFSGAAAMVRDNPSRIEALSFAIDVLTPFIKGLEKIAAIDR